MVTLRLFPPKLNGKLQDEAVLLIHLRNKPLTLPDPVRTPVLMLSVPMESVKSVLVPTVPETRFSESDTDKIAVSGEFSVTVVLLLTRRGATVCVLTLVTVMDPPPLN